MKEFDDIFKRVTAAFSTELDAMVIAVGKPFNVASRRMNITVVRPKILVDREYNGVRIEFWKEITFSKVSECDLAGRSLAEGIIEECDLKKEAKLEVYIFPPRQLSIPGSVGKAGDDCFLTQKRNHDRDVFTLDCKFGIKAV